MSEKSEAAKLLRESVEDWKEIQSLWDSALMGAAENTRRAGALHQSDIAGIKEEIAQKRQKEAEEKAKAEAEAKKKAEAEAKKKAEAEAKKKAKAEEEAKRKAEEEAKKKAEAEAKKKAEAEAKKKAEAEAKKKAEAEAKRKEIKDIQSIERKSINDFNEEDFAKTASIEKKYYNELGEKSPFFRAKNGDWRETENTPVMVVREKDNSRGPRLNQDTGWYINVSSKVFSETNNHESKATSLAKPYLDYIGKIIENAILLDSSTMGEKTKSENSLFMHSFYSVVDIGNGPEVIKLYVEEINNPNGDDTLKRAYQLQKIEKVSAITGVKVQDKIPSPITHMTDTEIKISNLYAYVKGNEEKNLQGEVQEERKYPVIDEDMARRAKQMNSFDDYKESSATAEFVNDVRLKK